MTLLFATPISPHGIANAEMIALPQASRPSVARAQKVVQALVGANREHLERFEAPICVRTTGTTSDLAASIEERFRDQARGLGLKLADSRCFPNILIKIATGAEIHEFTSKRFKKVGTISRDLEFDNSDDGVYVDVKSRGSAGGAETHLRGSLRLRNKEIYSDVEQEDKEASIILPFSNAPGLERGTIVIGQKAAAGRTPIQLADYAAMRLLGNTSDAIPPYSSILRLGTDGGVSIPALTSFDRIYLNHLYRSGPRSSTADFVSQTAIEIADANGVEVAAQQPRTAEVAVAPTHVRAVDAAMADQTDDNNSLTTAPSGSPSLNKDERPVWKNDIVVTAPKYGPALWRVRKGSSTIIILGAVSPLPRAYAWQNWRVRHEIRRSSELLVNSAPESNLVWEESWSSAAARRLRQPKGRVLMDDLTPRDRARLTAILPAAGHPLERYSSLRPAVAAMLLNADWREHSGLSNSWLGTDLSVFARRHRVHVQFITQTSLLPTIDALPGMDTVSQAECFDRLLSGIERERSRATDQATAWAIGDIAALRNSYIAPTSCGEMVLGDQRKRVAAMKAWTNLLLRSLERSNRQTFAIIDVASLLSPSGILSQLRAEGATIDTPPEIGPKDPDMEAME